MAWRLFFTKRNELDLGYAFLLPFLGLFFYAWVRAARGEWTVSVAMWTSLVSVIGSMLVATVPLARARIMRDRDYSDGMTMPYYSGDASSTSFSIAPADDAR